MIGIKKSGLESLACAVSENAIVVTSCFVCDVNGRVGLIGVVNGASVNDDGCGLEGMLQGNSYHFRVFKVIILNGVFAHVHPIQSQILQIHAQTFQINVL